MASIRDVLRETEDGDAYTGEYRDRMDAHIVEIIEENKTLRARVEALEGGGHPYGGVFIIMCPCSLALRGVWALVTDFFFFFFFFFGVVDVCSERK